MKRYRQRAFAILASGFMLFLIIHSNKAAAYAIDAIKLCCTSLVPSLFPFMFLSMVLSNALIGYRFHFFSGIRKVCRIPDGSEFIFILGILGGYPIGAQMVTNAYRCGKLERSDAQRMLGFCNQAGPAFIFGILGPLFHSGWIVAMLWLVQICSAILTGILLEGHSASEITIADTPSMSITEILERSVKVMALICGWVILFKIIIGFAQQYLLLYLPEYISILLCGLLELTNGCITLYELENSGARFILSALFLSTGGLCVALQTASATKPLNLNTYLIGKSIQGAISIPLAYILQCIIFPSYQRFSVKLPVILIGFLIIIGIILCYRKKTVDFRNKLIYN